MRHGLEVEGFPESIRDSLARFELLPLSNQSTAPKFSP